MTIKLELAGLILLISPLLVAADNTPTHAELREAHALRHNPSINDALKAIEAKLKTHPNNAELWEVHAELRMRNVEEVRLLRKRGQVRQGIEAYERVVELDPQAYRAQGLLYALYSVLPGMLGGDQDKAEAKMAELEALGQGLPQFALVMKATMEQREDDQIKHMREAIEAAPQRVEYQTSLVRLLIEKEDWVGAEEALAASLESHPDDIPLRYQRPRMRVLQENTSAEDSELLNDLIANSDSAPARFLPEALYLIRGRSFQLQGLDDEARADYEYVHQRTPNLIEEMKLAEYVESLL